MERIKSGAGGLEVSAETTPVDTALRSFAPGELRHIGSAELCVAVAPQAGGRIAQITRNGLDWLLGYGPDNTAMIGWGCFPMLPWAGRIRNGRFAFQGHDYQLPPGLGPHAIHGVGYALAWTVASHSERCIELSLQLPEDARWPFGGRAAQRIEVSNLGLRLSLTVTAGALAMPAVIGWHPWLRKPEQVQFLPKHIYPRDQDGIATLPLADPTAPPWDDCFINQDPVIVRRAGQSLSLTSNCSHWVIFDQLQHTTCIEPQSGPPDAFNLAPRVLAPGESLSAWFNWEWL